MGILNLASKGGWYLKSKSDPRWNDSGECRVGGFVMPRDCKKSIERTKQLLNEEPPDDLEWGYEKY